MTRSRTIEIVAPSGYPPDESAVERGIARLRADGHRVAGAFAAERRHQRFGGTDAQRAQDLNRLADPDRPLPDIVLALRGGYGASRILDSLDYAGLERRLAGASVAICGHSDFTAIQLALFARAGIVTFGGPMLTANFGAQTLSAFTAEHFWRALESPEFTVHEPVAQADEIDVDGLLWGGNLAMIASLVGTPYMPRIDGGILFLEDVNEHPFRLERMFYQLHLSGILARQKALVLGDFTGGKLSPYDNGYDFSTMVEQVRGFAGLPIVTGLRFGHGADLVTLPFGAQARLQAGQAGFSLTVSGHPTLR
ncbi:muramoyltetrapeptide carboxypeptidase [Trinickia dinghuensis]|uniref:Muramoyltetrapeptide carboxypeptidase n=1 Tax=Trinickia dinghuensis TaxID=2291023 RepID=A0A3D8K2J3_9BURK|nr:muramoyltetrapeptide carboxypeptidase [Trinickia dinghuensis]RDU99116.1 muramoyltetrapeptide carboxypeptidase [Trinickia dinghuensis]